MPKSHRGRRSWPLDRKRTFALRLYGVLCQRFGSDAPFERLKKELLRSGALVSESTIRGWLPPLERLKAGPNGMRVRKLDWDQIRTPDVTSLAEVSDLLDVSVDFLFGADVPQRVSDRREHESFGVSMLHHVVREYVGRPTKPDVDGLAHVIGATMRAYVRYANPAEAHHESEVTGTVTVLPGGEIIVQQHTHPFADRNEILVADTHVFLQHVDSLIFDAADAWNAEHLERMRRSVREGVKDLRAKLPALVTAMQAQTGVTKTRADILELLLDCALEPLNSAAQGALLTLTEQAPGEPLFHFD